MDLSFYTRRYVDRSKNTGFQFEFFCDRCNKGHLTPFRIHALGVVTSIWDATDWKKEKEKDFDFDTLKKDVSRLFLKGKAWIEAYTNAVEEAQKYFKHCARCLKWVCPRSCYNTRANLCQGCAPLTDAEKAALKAEEKRKETGKATVDAVDAPRVCPHCGKSNPVATFCADCGQKVAQDIFCPGCGCKWSTDKKMKFCPRCGEEMPQLVPRVAKPSIVKPEGEKKSERQAKSERAADKTIDTLADLHSEVKKVAEEYKSFAEDIFGLKPRKASETKSATPRPTATGANSAKSAGKTDPELKSREEHSGQTSAKESLGSGKKPGNGKAKTKSRKITKISKSKKTTAAKKKNATAANKPAKKKQSDKQNRTTKSNETPGQSKPKAKKKPKAKS